MRTVVAALALAGCTAAPLPAPPPPVEAPAPVEARTRVGGSTEVIDVDVVSADLADVLEAIGRQVGRNLLVDPTVQELVTVSLRAIRWREAVDVLACLTSCEVEERAGGILVLTRPCRVSLDLSGTCVRCALRQVPLPRGWRLLISPAVAGYATVHLEQLDWFEALCAIVRSAGPFEVVVECEGLARIVPRGTVGVVGRLLGWDDDEVALDTCRGPLRLRMAPARRVRLRDVLAVACEGDRVAAECELGPEGEYTLVAFAGD